MRTALKRSPRFLRPYLSPPLRPLRLRRSPGHDGAKCVACPGRTTGTTQSTLHNQCGIAICRSRRRARTREQFQSLARLQSGWSFTALEWEIQHRDQFSPNAAGKPMDLNNLLNRVILPTLNRCVHCGKGRSTHILSEHGFERDSTLPEWHGWHAARRGLGTNLYRLGVPEKTIQAILRHANVSTT